MRLQHSFVPGWHWILLSLALTSLYLVGASSHGLLEPDEGRYANMAMEWTEFAEHDWDEPVLSDVGHFDKPPLIYWVTGTSFLLFGNSELAARLPSLLGAFLTLAGVALLAWRQYGERAAWWSVLVCGTTIHFWALAQLLSPDMLLCGFCTLGAALTLSKDKGRRGTLLWLLGALCWVLAWWTKATASLVPLAAITAAILLTRRRDLVSSLKPLRLFLIILALGSPWYIAMMLRHPELEQILFPPGTRGARHGSRRWERGLPRVSFCRCPGSLASLVALSFRGGPTWIPKMAEPSVERTPRCPALGSRSGLIDPHDL
jgi:4-amino-4-deoxy-L-arabinose transferase-like glycosyltransferase